MVATSFVLAASSIFALTYGAPIARNNKASARSLVERASAKAYTVFGGDGSSKAGWPAQKNWGSFDDLWEINVGTIGISCTQFGQPNNNDQETAAIKSAIQKAATDDVPAQFILAIMMQESKGCVRVPTTNYGVRNPGLMQDHNGQASCNEGSVQNPCPDATISQMIEEGVGIGTDFGLKQVVAQFASSSDAQKYYMAARAYNSGSVDSSGNLGAGIATHCYASDIANRLRGWNGDSSSCSEGSVGGLTGSTGGYDDSDDNTEEPPETPAKPQPTTTTPPATTQPTTTPSQPSTNKPSTNNGAESTPSGPKGQGAVSNCTGWYTVKDNDTCDSVATKFNKKFDDLKKLNTGLDATCSNLWLGSSYCVSA